MYFIILAVLSYLLGSIPFGYLISKYNGINIQKVGSGNIGTTNVWRTLGWKWGLLTLISDATKGYLAIALVDSMFNEPMVGYYILAGSLAILGHFKPIWLGWKGGKVVATSLGVLLGLLPVGFIFIIIGIFGLILLFTKQVSVASISASLTAAVTQIILGGGFNQQNFEMTLFVIGVAVLIIYAHKDNIKRIFQGNESKI